MFKRFITLLQVSLLFLNTIHLEWLSFFSFLFLFLLFEKLVRTWKWFLYLESTVLTVIVFFIFWKGGQIDGAIVAFLIYWFILRDKKVQILFGFLEIASFFNDITNNITNRILNFNFPLITKRHNFRYNSIMTIPFLDLILTNKWFN